VNQNPRDDRGFDFKLDDLMNSFKANVAGPALISRALLPLVERSRRKVFVNLTSGLASFGLDFGPKCMSYTVSKTALNMLVSV
jgi:NAD(P)-dependent dehydrogenase (short-subunit alcohol dehydrogenase family)